MDRFTLAAAGDHMLHALVGGEAVRGAAQPLAAEYGPLTAEQCHAVLQGGGAPDANGHVAATCGAFQELVVEVRSTSTLSWLELHVQGCCDHRCQCCCIGS